MGLEDEATQDSVSSMPPPPVPPPLPSTPKQPPKMTQMPNSQAFQKACCEDLFLILRDLSY